MKKFLVVLLIAVLTVSSAFALTGEVKTTAAYDLDKKNFDIHTTGTIKGSYKLPFAAFFAGYDEKGATANEGAFPYAVAEATLTVKASKAGGDEWDFAGTAASGHTAAVPAVTVDYADSWKETKTLSLGEADLFTGVSAEVKLTKAEIIGEEWKLDFLTGPSVANYSSKIMDSELNAEFTTECPICEEVIGNKFDAIGGKFDTANTSSVYFEAEAFIAADEAYVAKTAAEKALATKTKAATTAKEKEDKAQADYDKDPSLANYKALENAKAATTAANTAADTAKATAEAAQKAYKVAVEAYAKYGTYTHPKATETAKIADYNKKLASYKADAAGAFQEGITFTWNKYGSVAIAAKAQESAANSYYFITLSSVDYALTDELKGQASVSFNKNGVNKLATYLSGKLAYANLVPGKLTANFAIDSFVAKKDGGIELNGDFAYDNNFITGEAYYASDAKYYTPDTSKAAHPYLETATPFAKNFTYFKATVDGTTKYPAFVPEFTAEGYSTETQKMVADWDLKSTYTKDAKSYFTANIGMTDTLKNNAAQTLYGSVATTVTNYKTLEDIGKLTFKLGAENFLDIDDDPAAEKEFFTKKSGAVTTAKESGFYFNASAEDFVVKGLKFIFSAADLINEKGQVFALDVTYADEKENVKATAGFATGLEKSIFKGESTFAYGDVNYKFNEELTGYAGIFALLGGSANWERYYVGADYVKKYADEKTNSLSARLDIYHGKDADAEVGLYAKAASTKIVNGAELALTYGANAAGIGALEKDTYFGNLTTKAVENPITATCTIKF